MTQRPYICEHGQLGRSCDRCDLLDDLKDLRNQLADKNTEMDKSKEELKKWQDALWNENKIAYEEALRSIKEEVEKKEE
jgi:hypothetical protein